MGGEGNQALDGLNRDFPSSKLEVISSPSGLNEARCRVRQFAITRP